MIYQQHTIKTQCILYSSFEGKGRPLWPAHYRLPPVYTGTLYHPNRIHTFTHCWDQQTTIASTDLIHNLSFLSPCLCSLLWRRIRPAVLTCWTAAGHFSPLCRFRAGNSQHSTEGMEDLAQWGPGLWTHCLTGKEGRGLSGSVQAATLLHSPLALYSVAFASQGPAGVILNESLYAHYEKLPLLFSLSIGLLLLLLLAVMK